MNVAAILPLALVMVAGPQILAAVFFATSARWKADSAAYILGGAISITAFYTISYFVTKAAKNAAVSQSSSTVHTVIDSVFRLERSLAWQARRGLGPTSSCS